jgi:hypothetical protein
MSKPINSSIKLIDSTRDIMEEETSVKIQEIITIINSFKEILIKTINKTRDPTVKECSSNQSKTCLSQLLNLWLLK